MVKIEGELIELSKRFDDILMLDFYIAVIEFKERPKIDFGKKITISQNE